MRTLALLIASAVALVPTRPPRESPPAPWRFRDARVLFDSKVTSEINMWSREEMVDLFLDGICESQDVKDFIANKFPGEGECPINKAVFKLIMFKKLKGAPVTLMEQELKDSL